MKKGYLILAVVGLAGLGGYLYYKNNKKTPALASQPVVEEEPEKQGLTVARPPLENQSFEEKMENMAGKPEKRLLINRPATPNVE